jgi:hypothetical protein
MTPTRDSNSWPEAEMTGTEYVSGNWHGVVTANAVALLPEEIDPGLSARVWATFEQGTGFSGLLDALTDAYGTSLASFPSFAVVAFDGDEARIAVRGPLTVEILESDGSQIQSIGGDRVTTWNESVIVAPRSITLIVKGVTTVDQPLLISSGVVRCSRIVTTLASPISTSTDERTLPEATNLAPSPAATTEAVKSPEPFIESSEETAIPENEMTVADEEETLADSGNIEPSTDESSSSNYDDLWGATIATSVESAAVRPPAEDSSHDPAPTPPARQPASVIASPIVSVGPAAVAEQAPFAGTMISGIPAFGLPSAVPHTPEPPPHITEHNDHDGETISLAQLQRMQKGAAHVTASVPSTGVKSAGKITVSTGDEAVLDRTVIIGRRPRATRVSGSDMPHLLAVPSPLQDISRSHVEIRVEGTHILAQDLDTTNGTILRHADDPPIRLHPGEATMIANHDVLDLGEGITVTFTGLQ